MWSRGSWSISSRTSIFNAHPAVRRSGIDLNPGDVISIGEIEDRIDARYGTWRPTRQELIMLLTRHLADRAGTNLFRIKENETIEE